jgi:hypothetical protein
MMGRQLFGKHWTPPRTRFQRFPQPKTLNSFPPRLRFGLRQSSAAFTPITPNLQPL